jgi:hypothetical protein
MFNVNNSNSSIGSFSTQLTISQENKHQFFFQENKNIHSILNFKCLYILNTQTKLKFSLVVLFLLT